MAEVKAEPILYAVVTESVATATTDPEEARAVCEQVEAQGGTAKVVSLTEKAAALRGIETAALDAYRRAA